MTLTEHVDRISADLECHCTQVETLVDIEVFRAKAELGLIDPDPMKRA